MHVPEKYLFYDGLPTAKDKAAIMAANGYFMADEGYAMAPNPFRHAANIYSQQVHHQQAQHYQPQQAYDGVVMAYDGLSGIAPIPDASWSGQGPNVPNPRYDQAQHFKLHAPPKPPRPKTVNNPNTLSDYLAGGIGIADSLIPKERIHKNYPTTPLPVYNPYPQGTGSQALSEWGGYMEDGGCADCGGDMAKSGIHIKKSHKGRFTAYKKRTGKTTEQALHSSDPHVRQMANFAKNAKKWHHEGGGIIDNPMTNFYPPAAENGMDVLEQFLPRMTGQELAYFGSVLEQFLPRMNGQGELESDEAKGGNWIKGAVNPKHKGYCTPMTKSTCTGRRRAFAKTMKKHHGFHEEGGEIENHVPTPHEQTMMNMAKGGNISAAKAKEMLRDGTAQGHKLTGKQKRYFGWIAGGRKGENGMEMYQDGGVPDHPTGKPWEGFSDAKKKVDLSDLMSYNIVNKGDKKTMHDYQGVLLKNATSTFGVDKGRKLYNEISIFNQDPQYNKLGPDDRIRQFYELQSQDKDVQDIKNQFRNFGSSGPAGLYDTSPDVNVQSQRQETNLVAKKASGGNLSEGSTHDMSEEEIAGLLKKGYRIEYL